ncbi:Hvo_1808 family surface protein [Halorientalis brevis]|uniref:Hvo_1808 family surface protein n=1 Tax=Halorientalis brevis TaxID=1126241 RepID=A0ABD6CEG6_9EURY|nr:Hvo_1808 family surface protein [Halorientalis brevis]
MRKAPWLVLVVLVVLSGCNLLGGSQAPPDPTADVVGWENGHWHNGTLDVTNEDGLNASEREAVVARSMARIEYIRDAEFNQSVPVEIISREEYRAAQAGNYTRTFRTFDNAKFEAMFFVGERRDALAVQRQNMGASVLGYYDPQNGTIKLVADGGQPTLDGEGTLAHELVHALQDQRHNLSTMRASTRDGYNAQNGVVEGEANYVQQRYEDRCGGEWECVDGSSGSQESSDLHFGIYFLEFFPYSDGPGFVSHLYEQGGWSAVDDAFASPPTSAEQVIYPDRYTDPADDPVAVELRDSATNGWERVRPDPQTPNGQRPDYATLGQSALSAMFAYTAYADRGQPVIEPRQFLNVEGGEIDRSDPYDYGLSVTSGWEGDRMHVYRNPDTDANETAYVWRIEWESAGDAREFASGYRQLLRYWGGERTDRANTWTVPDGNRFADAFRVTRDGATVTVVNAPTVDDLGDVRDGS